MANPKINISSLDFDSIKTSLKTYLSGLKNADGTLTFEGYDFDGAGINVLLDILSYNTLYYSFYSNMIGNETFLDTAQIENNIVSLVKPLGYLVTGKSASKTEMTVKSVSTTDTLTAYTDFFTALSTSGASYRFYPIQNYSLASGANTDIVLYEGRTVANNLQIVVDIADQKGFLGNTNIDLNTLTVKVNGTAWTQYSAFQANPGPDSEVYFLDRTSSGFYIIFGKKTLNDYQATFGKQIAENDVVTVSYMVPSGTVANNITSIKNSKVTASSTSKSAGGTDGVDLDLVKFFAPKMFAANDRAVTKDDYYGLLFSSNILPSSITQSEQVNVWGGEEADPPAFGRVFISYADTTLTTNTASVKKSIAFLKNKSVVTVLPEYVQPQTITAQLSVVATGASTAELAGIKKLIEDNYNTTLIFNNSVVLTDIKNLITDNYSSVRRVDMSSASLLLVVKGSGSDKALYFKNQLNDPSTAGEVVSSTSFSYKGITINLVDQKINSTEGYLVARNASTGAIINSFGNLGSVDYSIGSVAINGNVLSAGTDITVTAKPKYTDLITIKNEFLVNVSATVTGA
jgi:hypothetical protein